MGKHLGKVFFYPRRKEEREERKEGKEGGRKKERKERRKEGAVGKEGRKGEQTFLPLDTYLDVVLGPFCYQWKGKAER